MSLLRQSLRALTSAPRRVPRVVPLIRYRSLHNTPPTLATNPKSTTGPSRSQSEGHATHKASQSTHKDADVQSAAVSSSRKSHKETHGKNSTDGDSQPLDAARQGGEGGEKKSNLNGTGAMRDQVGGQESTGSPGGMGGTESASAGTFAESVKKSLGMSGKAMPADKNKKSFHTSTHSLTDKPKSPRAPKESNLQGDQNTHLKHKDPKSKDSGKGNAAETPHLPSHNKKGSSSSAKDGSGGGKGKKGLHTSAVREVENVKALEGEEKKAGYNAPPEALPSSLNSNYDKSQTHQSPGDLKPKLETGYSSTAVDPPNEALRKGVLEGTLPDKNAPPSGEVGKKGVKEAWKDRGI